MIQPNGHWYSNPGWFLFIVAMCGVLSGFFGNWVSQTKDLSNITTSVMALVTDQKLQDSRINLTSERVAVLENNLKIVNENLSEIKKDVKELLKRR
jgi:cob(I)alamin adenosyltransferase